jgi:hypothetical protein
LRVTLHFHADRLVAGVPILELMARDGVYRSQFETWTSNGGLTAHPGGDRWRWESRIFAAAYDDALATDRPKYGSLNFRRCLVGGSPRFGSAHLRLARSTTTSKLMCTVLLTSAVTSKRWSLIPATEALRQRVRPGG